jgi:hypothetical protein
MPRDNLTRPYLILVEGPGDAAFFRRLIVERGIPNEFDVLYPSQVQGVSGSGNSRFGDALDGFALIPGFDDLQGILVVADNDDDSNTSFAYVQAQIRGTAAQHPVPQVPLRPTNGNPPLAIMMIPWTGEDGSIETLCAIAAETAFPKEAACADQFQTCTGVDAWPPSKRSKVKLRSIISAVHRRNPDVSLSFLWHDRADLVPLNHTCFDRITDYLMMFHHTVRGP